MKLSSQTDQIGPKRCLKRYYFGVRAHNAVNLIFAKYVKNEFIRGILGVNAFYTLPNSLAQFFFPLQLQRCKVNNVYCYKIATVVEIRSPGQKSSFYLIQKSHDHCYTLPRLLLSFGYPKKIF